MTHEAASGWPAAGDTGPGVGTAASDHMMTGPGATIPTSLTVRRLKRALKDSNDLLRKAIDGLNRANRTIAAVMQENSELRDLLDCCTCQENTR